MEDGDIVNVDVTAYLYGYHGDTSQTWLVGDVVSPPHSDTSPILAAYPKDFFLFLGPPRPSLMLHNKSSS